MRRHYETTAMRKARRNRSARRAVVMEVLSYLSIPVLLYYTVSIVERLI